MIEEYQQDEVVAVEEQPPKLKKKRRVLVDVRIIERAGESALVEWAKPPSGTSRGFIEVAKIESGSKVDAEVLNKNAHPYGVPWGKLVDLEAITPQVVEDELHRCGIWVTADIESRLGQVQRAILVVMSQAGLTVGELHNRGSEYERFKREEA